MQSIQIPLTPAQWEQKRAEATRAGVQMTGDTGQTDYRGVDLSYTYDGTALTIEITHVSLADRMAGWGEDRIAQKLRELLA
jgi:hypothetical protein